MTAAAKDYPMLWLHCDAAYAGVAMSLPEVREASTDLAAINECFDSYSTNMHKWGREWRQQTRWCLR